MAAGAFAVARRYIVYREARARRREEQALRLRRRRWPGGAAQPGRSCAPGSPRPAPATRIASRPRRSPRRCWPVSPPARRWLDLERSIVLAARTRIETRPGLLVRRRAGAAARHLRRGAGTAGRHRRDPRRLPLAFVEYMRRGGRAGAAGAGDARLRPGAAGRGAGAGARSRLPVPRLQTLYDRYLIHNERAAHRAAADALDAGGDGSGAAGGGPRGAGDRLLRPDLVVPLLPLDADALQRRHALPAALVVLPDDGQRRPRGDLQDDARQRPSLQVERRHRQRLDPGARPRQPHQGHQRRRARASSPSSRSPTTPPSRSIRAASARARSAPTSRPGTSTSRSSSTCARTPATIAAAPTT